MYLAPTNFSRRWSEKPRTSPLVGRETCSFLSYRLNIIVTFGKEPSSKQYIAVRMKTCEFLHDIRYRKSNI